MNKIGNHPKYGEVFDSPGGSGGNYMINIVGVGWVKNPNYPVQPVSNGGGGGSGMVWTPAGYVVFK